MSDRAKLFDDDDLDLSGFKPKEGPQLAGPDPEAIRAVSEAAQFSSREPKAAPSRPAAQPVRAEAAPLKREPRRHRTGRTVQFNCRTTQDCFDGMYAIADQKGWLVGETLENALAALQRELTGQGRG